MAPQLFGIDGRIDFYKGVHIDLDDANGEHLSAMSLKEAEKEVEKYVKKAKNAKKYTSLWVKIPNDVSNLISAFIKNGFDYHHAKSGYAMLYQWIEPSQIDRVPKYAHHVIGVGGLVYNSKTDKVLLIRERLSHSSGSWKFPGGANDPGESFPETALRETLEETGVRCRFKSVLVFRHQIEWSFGCSDLFILCLLAPEDEDNCVPVKCEHEIAECEWKSIEDAKRMLSGMNLVGLKQFLDKKLFKYDGNLYTV